MIESFDPVSLPLWLLAAFAAAQYPLALMFGAECSLCCCRLCNPEFDDCCGDDFTRISGGVCCDEVWHPDDEEPPGECCDDEWHTDEGVCCQTLQVPISITSCSGAGASANAVKNYGSFTVVLSDGGADYAILGRTSPTLTFEPFINSGLSTTLTLEEVAGGCGPTWRIASVSFSGGTGFPYTPGYYQPPVDGNPGGFVPPVDTSAWPVTAAEGDVTLTAAQLLVRADEDGVPQEITIANVGSYYREDAELPAITPDITVEIDPAFGSGAALSATVDDDPESPTFGQITGITVDDAGEEWEDWDWELGPVWHVDGGECCRGVWYPDSNPCPEGQVYITIAQFGQECCGCFPDEIMDPRVPGMVPTLDVVNELQCCCNILSLGVDAEDQPVPCVSRCCTPIGPGSDELVCTEQSQQSCEDGGGESLAGCCDQGCPAGCCTEDADGVSQCENKDSGECISEGGHVIWPDCETTGCVGACCVDGESQGLLTQEQCDAVGGCWAGAGEEECLTGCRSPFDANCCETVVSAASGLTFTQPRRRSCEPSDTLWMVTATGTTDSPILIHGVPFGQDATPAKRCPFDITFPICWDKFSVEPLPCNSSFRRLDITVCWQPEGLMLETLNYSGCNDITLWLGECDRDCETVVSWAGAGITVGAAVEMRGDATINSNGSGPMTWPSINQIGDCNRTLTLSGSNDDENTMAAIEAPTLPATTSLRKTGTGLWRLNENSTYNGSTEILHGTIIVGASTLSTSGAFGEVGLFPVVGDPSSGATGFAALLLAENVSFAKGIQAASSDGSQVVYIGAAHTSGQSSFSAKILLGRPVVLRIPTGATVEFANTWENGEGTDFPAEDVTIGSPGHAGTALIANNLSTSGTVTVANGLAIVEGALAQIEYAELVVVDGVGAELRYLSALAFTNPLDLNAGTFSGDVDAQGLVTVGGNATINVETGDTITLSGGLAGNSTLTKDGDGTLAITSISTFTGTLSLSGGVLAGDTSLLSVDIAAASTISVDADDEIAITSSLSGEADVTKEGDGTLNITGSSASLSGVLIISQGVLAGDTSISSIEVAGASTISVAAGDEIAVTFEIYGSGALTKNGAGTLRLTGANTLAGTLTLSEGVLAGDVDITGAAVIGGAASVNVETGDSITFSGGLTGSAALEKDGAGTLNLGAGNAWTGELTVNAGAVDVAEIYTNPSSLATGATITSTTVTVAFSSTPASGAQYRILPGSVGNAITTVTLAGTAATGTFNTANSTLTIN